MIPNLTEVVKEYARHESTVFQKIAESYSELKANENFISLQNSLSDIESKIACAKQFYNDSVTIYNTKIAVFPSI